MSPEQVKVFLESAAENGWCLVERGDKELWIHKSRLDELCQDGDIVWFPPPAIVPNPAILDVPIREEGEQ